MKMTDMFPSRVLRGQDLDKPILAEITCIKIEKMRAGQGKPEETKHVLYFENISTGKPVRLRGVQYVPDHGHGLVLRKSLAIQIFVATQTADTEHWLSQRIVLYPCKVKARGEEVTTICARAPRADATSASTSLTNAPTDEADETAIEQEPASIASNVTTQQTLN
jgi:hypothetical protein